MIRKLLQNDGFKLLLDSRHSVYYRIISITKLSHETDIKVPEKLLWPLQSWNFLALCMVSFFFSSLTENYSSPPSTAITCPVM